MIRTEQHAPPRAGAGHRHAKRRTSEPLNRCGGFALVLVLWMTVLVSVIAASVVFQTRLEVRTTASSVDLARAAALADAGVYLGIAELISPGGDGWNPDGRPNLVTLGDGTVTVTLVSEGGKVDINTAQAPLIRRLAEMIAGAEEGPALADAILDWRDHDDERRPQGAEAADYARAGAAHGPRDAAFLSVEELLGVRGMDDARYRAVKDLVTVHSRSPRLDARTASPRALLVVPGMTQDMADRLVSLREEIPTAQILPQLGLPNESLLYVAPSVPAAIYSVTAEARAGDTALARKRAVIAVTGVESFEFLAWYEHDAH